MGKTGRLVLLVVVLLGGAVLFGSEPAAAQCGCNGFCAYNGTCLECRFCLFCCGTCYSWSCEVCDEFPCFGLQGSMPAADESGLAEFMTDGPLTKAPACTPAREQPSAIRVVTVHELPART
jgi:hypothetical protein